MRKNCLHCGKEFETKSKSFCCCKEHLIMFKNHRKFPEESDYVECKLCGYRARELEKHIVNAHSMSVEEYCSMFNVDQTTLITELRKKENSEAQKKAYREGRNKGWNNGGINPSKTKEGRSGRRSPFSMNFSGYDGLSDTEKAEKIAEIKARCVGIKRRNHSNPLSLDYYTSRGYSEEQATILLKERQTTFSLKKCIEKYGEEKGYDVWKKRQEVWQNTLNNLPEEEQKRILKAKTCNGKGYSDISQTLFLQIDARIHSDFKEIYYATNGASKLENNEYVVIDKRTNKKFLLDFYVKDVNKVIEFDGDYWHSDKRGNKLRDSIREEKLKELGFVNIMRVKERDYKANPKKVLEECVAYLKG